MQRTMCLMLRPLLSVLPVLVALVVSGQSIDADSLNTRQGIGYAGKSTAPFTGTVIVHGDSGHVASTMTYKQGIPNGKLAAWYPNGAKQVEGQLHGDTRIGLWKAWYANGKLKRQGAFKDGKEEGRFSWYYENGRLSKQGDYHAGTEDGKWVWYHENGKRMQEGVLKGDTSIGTWKEWYPDGRPKMVGTFVNGAKHGEWTWWDEAGKRSTRSYAADSIVQATDSVDLYVERMGECMTKRDLNGALANVDRAILLIDDRSEQDPRYMWLCIFKSKVYALFRHIGTAQSVLLAATGIPEDEVRTIVNAHDSTAFPALRRCIERLSGDPALKTRLAPHVALALVYNMVQDTVRMKEEQQLMMDRADTEDQEWIMKMSLTLYGLQAEKEQGFADLAQARRMVDAEGADREREHVLAVRLTDLAQYPEAALIAKKYLALDPEDLDFILIQLNIAMGTGDLQGMADLRAKALRIDPHALDE